MKRCLRNFGMCLVRLFGSRLSDAVDGTYLGRAFMIRWRGRMHLIGYEGLPLKPVCIPQKGVNYWRITVGFVRAEIPDYPSIAGKR